MYKHRKIELYNILPRNLDTLHTLGLLQVFTSIEANTRPEEHDDYLANLSFCWRNEIYFKRWEEELAFQLFWKL